MVYNETYHKRQELLGEEEIMPDRQELTIREQLEARETQYLSQYAKLSRDSAGRKREEGNAIFARSFKETETVFCTANHFAG